MIRMKIFLVLTTLLYGALAAELNHVNGFKNFQHQGPSLVYQSPARQNQQDLSAQFDSFQAFQPQQPDFQVEQQSFQLQQQNFLPQQQNFQPQQQALQPQQQHFESPEQPQQIVSEDVRSSSSVGAAISVDNIQQSSVDEQPQVTNFDQGFAQSGDLQIIGVSSNLASISNVQNSVQLQPVSPSQSLDIVPASLMLHMNDEGDHSSVANDVLNVQEVSTSQSFTPNHQENQNLASPQVLPRTYKSPQLVLVNQGQQQQINVPQTLPFILNTNNVPINNVQEPAVEQRPEVSGVFFEQTIQSSPQVQDEIVPDLPQPQIAEQPVEQPFEVIVNDEETTDSPSVATHDTFSEDLVATKPLTRPEFKPTSVARVRKIETTRCGDGLLADARGDCVEPQIVRNVYLYAAPKQERKFKTLKSVPKPKIEYNIVFVRSPDKDALFKPLVAPAPQQKTLVYVLNKKLAAEDQDLIEVPVHPKLEPEVYFVNYGEDENPQLPGGIDLRTALSEVALEGTVIGDASGSLTHFVESVDAPESFAVENLEVVRQEDDASADSFFVATADDDIDVQTEASEEGYKYPESSGFEVRSSINNGNEQ
ncbi:uncharacterized protein LOC108671546 [Hyalella azteca]|uniref:Uncharacterized protein LOC108671546 n=1 Tax=Hyalella azteca TaxID=294128 RepID=A0A8B7NLQ9_HYAAZ|nr:uncharacterized protein LOC108671546 [Hyalella azteca]